MAAVNQARKKEKMEKIMWLNKNAIDAGRPRLLAIYAVVALAVNVTLFIALSAGMLAHHGGTLFVMCLGLSALILISGVMAIVPVLHWVLMSVACLLAFLPLFPTFQYELLWQLNIDLTGAKSLKVAVPAVLLMFSRLVWTGVLSDPRYVKTME